MGFARTVMGAFPNTAGRNKVTEKSGNQLVMVLTEIVTFPASLKASQILELVKCTGTNPSTLRFKLGSVHIELTQNLGKNPKERIKARKILAKEIAHQYQDYGVVIEFDIDLKEEPDVQKTVSRLTNKFLGNAQFKVLEESIEYTAKVSNLIIPLEWEGFPLQRVI